jgi:hypothetical protein
MLEDVQEDEKCDLQRELEACYARREARARLKQIYNSWPFYVNCKRMGDDPEAVKLLMAKAKAKH